MPITTNCDSLVTHYNIHNIVLTFCLHMTVFYWQTEIKEVAVFLICTGLYFIGREKLEKLQFTVADYGQRLT